MNTRDQFGNYLLLKKLGEDALGESFRGGRIGRQGVDRVVLLRVFNGQGLDAPRLAQHLAGQSALQQALRSPALGAGSDLGEVRGVPFVAYDYISGRSLATILEQATKKGSPVPFDHAMLIAERAAMGLSVAYETKVGDERTVHGFLVPALVMISNEGETRLLGFEAAAGLRGAAAHPLIKEACGRYLAPEALAGAPRQKSDDVFSLGAIFYELLTGDRLPVQPAGGFASLIDQAQLANEGTALPAPIVELLKKSLAPREQRLPEALSWHKAIAKLMVDGQYSPTTFNLAFYMHSLFRDEIERESQEIEAEKTIQISAETLRQAAAQAVPTPAPVAAGAAAAAVGAAAARPLADEYGLPPKKKGPPVALIAGIVGGLAVVAIGGYLLFGRGGSAPPATTPAPTAAATSPGMSPEQIQAQLEKMLEEKLKAREGNLKQQYDDQIKAMQKQLDEAKRATDRPAPTAATAAVAAVTATPAAVATVAPTPPPAAELPKPTPRPTEAPAVETPRPTPTAVATAAPVATAAANGANFGDLFNPGPGVVPPKKIKPATLRYPPIARRMGREATVNVRVLIDENGRVTQAEVPTKVGLGFDEAAIENARSTSFSPPTKNGVRGKMWIDFKVVFSLNN